MAVTASPTGARVLHPPRFVALAAALFGFLIAAGLLAFSCGPAEALPSYARQTGQPCAACHTIIPELTPFGRRFKIGGYTLQGGDWQGPPLAAMYIAGFTHMQSPYDYTTTGAAWASDLGTLPAQANVAPAGLHANDNLVSQ